MCVSFVGDLFGHNDTHCNKLDLAHTQHSLNRKCRTFVKLRDLQTRLGLVSIIWCTRVRTHSRQKEVQSEREITPFEAEDHGKVASLLLLEGKGREGGRPLSDGGRNCCVLGSPPPLPPRWDIKYSCILCCWEEETERDWGWFILLLCSTCVCTSSLSLLSKEDLFPARALSLALSLSLHPTSDSYAAIAVADVSLLLLLLSPLYMSPLLSLSLSRPVDAIFCPPLCTQYQLYTPSSSSPSP